MKILNGPFRASDDMLTRVIELPDGGARLEIKEAGSPWRPSRGEVHWVDIFDLPLASDEELKRINP